MSWNHRLCKQTIDGKMRVAIHEVYYNKAGEPWCCTVEPITLDMFADFDETEEQLVESIKENLKLIGTAYNYPVLDLDTIVWADLDD